MINETDRFLQSATANDDESIDSVRDRFMNQIAQMREQLDGIEGAALDKAKRAARVASPAPSRHVYGAVGIWAAVGLLAGVLIARR